MNEQENEILSALMDGECEDQLIDSLLRDSTMRATWWRYHLISDAMKGKDSVLATKNLAEKVSKVLANEATVLSPKSTARWIKPVAGFAIAASVAVVAVLSIQQNNEMVEPALGSQAIVQHTPVQTLPRQQFSSATAQLASVQKSLPESIPAAAQINTRMNSYMLNYNEFRTTSTKMQGMLPYVRIIAHDTEE